MTNAIEVISADGFLEVHATGALWEDIKFDMAHWKDIERLAIVGESKWEEGMATFCKPVTMAKVKYFDHEKIEEARTWLTEK